MDSYISSFEKNVNSRIHDLLYYKTKNTDFDFRPTSLLLGISFGVIVSRIACLYNIKN